MNLGDISARRQKRKTLKTQIRQAKKEMLGAGCEKEDVRKLLGEFEETLLRAEELFGSYQIAVRRLRQSREAIERLLEDMGERPPREIRKELEELLQGMDHIFHDCTIRQDDMDFQSSVASLKKLASNLSNENAMENLLLRSELENMKAVLDDVAEFCAPDFFALAYYCLHENAEALKEMENAQRNLLLDAYLKEHFTERFQRETDPAGMTETLEQLKQSYIHGETE